MFGLMLLRNNFFHWPIKAGEVVKQCGLELKETNYHDKKYTNAGYFYLPQLNMARQVFDVGIVLVELHHSPLMKREMNSALPSK